MTRATAAAMATRLERAANAPSGTMLSHSGSEASAAASAADTTARRMLHSFNACFDSGTSFISAPDVQQLENAVTQEGTDGPQDDKRRCADGGPPTLELLPGLLPGRCAHRVTYLYIADACRMLVQSGVVGLQLSRMGVCPLLHARQPVKYLV